MTTNSNIHSLHTPLQMPHPQNQPMDAPCSEITPRPVEILYPLAHKASASVVGVCLQKKSLLRLTGDHSGEKLAVDAGVIWLTQSGDPEDIFLHTGEAFEISRPGPILIEGVSDSRLNISAGKGSPKIGRTLGNAVHALISTLPERFF
jgi:hypothetical protein